MDRQRSKIIFSVCRTEVCWPIHPPHPASQVALRLSGIMTSTTGNISFLTCVFLCALTQRCCSTWWYERMWMVVKRHLLDGISWWVDSVSLKASCSVSETFSSCSCSLCSLMKLRNRNRLMKHIFACSGFDKHGDGGLTPSLSVLLELWAASLIVWSPQTN